LPDQTIILGVLDLSTPEIETPETVAARIRRALRHRKPEDIMSPRTAASNTCRARQLTAR
jgi:methionine synthase II (cobalamin-independent)